MKIGIILPHLRIFGGIRRFLEVGRLLMAHGHDVTYYVKETGPLAWYDPIFSPKIELWPKTYPLATYLIGDPPSFPQLAKIGHLEHVYVWVIAGGKYIPMYQKLYNEPSRLPFNHFLLNNRVFLPSFPSARLCEGGVNTRRFTPWIIRVGYYAGRGEMKGESHIVKSLSNIKHIDLVPIEGFGHNALVEVYRSLHYFVAWEQRPGWSNTAAEALACGISVVTNGVNVEPFRNRCIVVEDLRDFFVKPMEEWSWYNTVDRLEQIWKEDGHLG